MIRRARGQEGVLPPLYPASRMTLRLSQRKPVIPPTRDSGGVAGRYCLGVQGSTYPPAVHDNGKDGETVRPLDEAREGEVRLRE